MAHTKTPQIPLLKLLTKFDKKKKSTKSTQDLILTDPQAKMMKWVLKNHGSKVKTPFFCVALQTMR